MWDALPADYASTVPRPMDLRTLGERLARGAYATHGDFRDDLALIWANAIRYNEPKVLDPESQAVVADARQMAAEMEVAWAETCLHLWDRLVCTQVESETAQRRRDDELEHGGGAGRDLSQAAAAGRGRWRRRRRG